MPRIWTSSPGAIVGVWYVAQPVAPASAPAVSLPGVSFQNSWANIQLLDGSYSPLRYRKTEGGFEIFGAISGGNFGSVIITLPPAFRPTDDLLIPITSADGTRIMTMQILANGNVSVIGITNTLPNSGVTAGTYGDATHVGQFSVDSRGIITFAGNVAITANSPLTTKGDIYCYSTTNDRLPVGADGTLLVADSGQTTGLKWATAPPGAISQSYVGYNTVGGTALTIGTSATLQILKSITVGASPVLLNSIDLYMHGDGNHAAIVGVGVWSDNSGVPLRQLGLGSSQTAFLDTNPRWVIGPMGMWLSASTTYWLYAFVQTVPSAATAVVYYDGSGGDYTSTSGTLYNDGLGATNSSRQYSLRGSTIA